jgi:hypothetical protein
MDYIDEILQDRTTGDLEFNPHPNKLKKRPRGKGSGPGSGLTFSFNLTQTGRTLLAMRSRLEKKSRGKILDDLALNLPEISSLPVRKTSAKGGRPSFFFGKNRGTTTAPYVKPETKKTLDENAKACGMSRGDYIEALLRSVTDTQYVYMKTLEKLVGKD